MTTSSGWRLRGILLAVFGLLSPWFWVKFPVCVWLGVASLRWLAGRATSDRRLDRILLGSFGLRTLLGIAFYMISSSRWPILRSLQIPGGFWLFGLDADVYNSMGVQIADMWRRGTELFIPETMIDYHVVVAAIYWLLDAHPLYPVLLNCWLGALTGWLAYRIGERLFDERTALTGAILVSFWPSSLLWSSQLLKDTPCWWLLFLILWLVVLSAAPGPGPAHVRLTRRALGAAGFVGSVVLLTRLRVYVGSTLAVAALATLVPASCASLVRGRVGRAVRLAGMAGLIVFAVMTARSLNVVRLVSPAHPDIAESTTILSAPPVSPLPPVNPPPSSAPEAPSALISQAELLEAAVLIVDPLPPVIAGQPYLAHVWSGWASWQAGERANAETEFWQAIRARPWSPVGYVALGALLIEQERLREALEVYVSWPGVKEKPVLGPLTDQLLAAMGEEALVQWAELAPKAAPAVTLVPKGLSGQALAMLREMNPRWIGALRQSFVESGGHTLMGLQVDLVTQPRQLLPSLPLALEVAFLAPFPGQWFDTTGSTGVMRVVAGAETALIYLLLPWLLVGLWRAARRPRVETCFLAALGLSVAVAVSLVVANLGTFFRLRLLYWLPFLILVAAGDPLGRARQVATWLRRRRVQPLAAGDSSPPVMVDVAQEARVR